MTYIIQFSQKEPAHMAYRDLRNKYRLIGQPEAVREMSIKHSEVSVESRDMFCRLEQIADKMGFPYKVTKKE